MAVPAEARTPNVALISLREDAGLSQEALADALNELAIRQGKKDPRVTKKTVGRWERGEVVWPQPFYRRLLADYFDCAADELGFRRPHRTSVAAPAASSDPVSLLSPPSSVDERVEQDQQRWKETRAGLGQHRQGLAVCAAQLYPEYQITGAEASGAIAHPAWLPDQPVPLSEIHLELNEEAKPAAVTGSERESSGVRPLVSSEKRYRRYSKAVRDLAAPRLFENRLCFRLVGMDWTTRPVRFEFGKMGFFDSIDTNETVAHETAANHLVRDSDGGLSVGRSSWRRLSFRKLLGDPFDLTRRPLMGAIGTLTIRGGESPSMVLHQRYGGRVAGGGGMAHLLPAGIFQPSSVLPDALVSDFSVWRNIQREFAEELLGHVEYDGSGRPVDYDHEPFAAMDRARNEGRMRLYCLGVTLDALTLSGDILTVAVIEPDTYDELFADAVDVNDEGAIPTRTVPFEGNTIAHLQNSGELSPGASAAIQLAWKHRDVVLHGQR